MADGKWKWLGVDHITYAVWSMDVWREIYVKMLCFREIHYTADACPGAPSSMELCGLESGNSRVALVAPIDRKATSHVTTFLDMHGDHSIQHVAYAIENLEAFVVEMKAKGFNFLGRIKVRSDSFGPVKQIFAKRFDASLTPAEGAFFEFVERPKAGVGGAEEFFSSEVAAELYADVEGDIATDDGKPFIDLMKMIRNSIGRD